MIEPQDIRILLPDIIHENQTAAELIDACLSALLAIGFDRARYYELDDGDPDDGPLCVLTHQLPTMGTVLRGYTIPWRETALQTLGGGRAVVCAPDGTRAPSTAWEDDLALRGRQCIDIPVRAGGRTLGLLAADCAPGRISLDDSDRSTLAILGSIAGSATLTGVVSTPPAVAVEEQQPFATTPGEYAAYAGRHLLDEVGAEVAAVFEFDWRRSRLVKIREWALGEAVQVDEFPETYSLGEHLTGLAWQEPTFRYVPDFTRLMRNRPDLVSQPSVDFHRSLLGHPLKTVLYAVLGLREYRYLVRVFNRAADPELPFLNLRKRFISAAEVLSIGLDDLIARRRLHFLASTASAAISNVTKPERVVKAGSGGLQDEGLHDFVLICQTAGSRRPALVSAAGRFGTAKELLTNTDMAEDAGFGQVASRQGTLLSEKELSAQIPELAVIVAEALGPTEPLHRRLFACFSAESGPICALLLAHVSDMREGRSQPSVRVPGQAVEAIQTLLGLFVEAVDSKYAHLTVRGARQALGYIGHELGTPLAMLGDAAVAAIMGTLEDLSRLEELEPSRRASMRVKLRRHYQRVQDSRGATNSALRLAPLVVQVGEGVLQVYFTKESVRELVNDSVEQITFATRNRQSRESGASVRDRSKRFRIEVQNSVTKLGDVVCDRYLIRQVLVNLLDNAVKYSLPRWPHRQEEMIVTVSGQRLSDDSVTLTVQNWGLPVETENSQIIFEAFVRGEQEDRLKAIRGMGLGLYLSRLIATAHKGSLELRSSERRGEDAGRSDRANSEGFLTTFELRLPGSLPIGPKRFEWSEGRGVLQEGVQSG